jgi:hypothetical protein
MRHLRIVKPRDPSGPRKRYSHAGSALTEAQQAKVRAVLRTLRWSYGGWDALAEVMGLAKKSAYHLVNPRHVITGDTLVRTCKAGGMSVDAMLGDTLTEAGRCQACGSRRFAS